MRTLLMTSAAIIIGTGAALAQSAGSSSAGGTSTGSAAGSTMTAPNNAAGSTIANPPTASGSGMASSGTGVLVPPSTNDKNTLAPAATNDSGMTNPGTSGSPSGPAATAKPSISKTTYQPGPMHRMHHALPAEASAGKYLRIALKAIKHHDAATADEALSRAETRLLTRSVDAAVAAGPDTSPGVQAVSNARQALKSGDFATAAQDTQQAMSSAGQDSMDQDSTGMSGNMGTGMDTPADRASGNVPDTTSDSGMKNPGSGTSVLAPGGPMGQ